MCFDTKTAGAGGPLLGAWIDSLPTGAPVLLASCSRMAWAHARANVSKKLQALGKYDPLKPTEPDPERWLPKKQRSYNKRFAGRKGAKGSASKTFSGAQGGDASTRDAAKLDMYAKHQAEKAAAAAEEEKAGAGKIGIEKQQKRGGKKGRGKG